MRLSKIAKKRPNRPSLWTVVHPATDLRCLTASGKRWREPQKKITWTADPAFLALFKTRRRLVFRPAPLAVS